MEEEDINISNDFMQNDDDGPKIVQENCYWFTKVQKISDLIIVYDVGISKF